MRDALRFSSSRLDQSKVAGLIALQIGKPFQMFHFLNAPSKYFSAVKVL
jgi:hypothetical protein